MSETPDKRRRTDLDLFVLALIDSGVSTPYELQKTAGISQGASTPALLRLLESRLVRQRKSGPRGRTDYQVTAAGKKALDSGWRILADEGPSGDLDADLRVALLVLWISGDRRLAAQFLRQSAEKKMESLAAIERGNDSNDVPTLARWYSALRLESAKAVLKAESAAAWAIAESLPHKPVPPRSGRKRATRS